MSGDLEAAQPNIADRASKAEVSRQRILDAAARCFVEVGYSRTRLEDVAQRAGVSRALVYNYFESKENLLARVRDGALRGWREAVAPQIDLASNAERKLRAMLHHTLIYARTRPLLQAILTDDVRVVVLGSESSAQQPIGQWREQIVEILRRGVADGEFRADLDVDHSADVIRAMQLGVIDRMHRPDGPIDVSTEAHVAAFVDLVVGGVAA